MAANGNDDDSGAAMQRLPDDVLRRVFKHLPAFSDAKNCRLVCKQWNRLAWANINFLLVAERLAPTKSCWKRATAPPGLAQQDRFLIRLAGLRAKKNERAMLAARERQYVTFVNTKFYFHQMLGAIGKLQHKIRIVQLCIKPTLRELQHLQTLLAHLPAATLVFTGTGRNHFSEWAEFQREKPQPGRVSQAPLELRKMVLRWAEPESDESSANVKLLTTHARFIRDISADDWRCIQQTLDAHGSSNNDNSQTLVFEQCEKLVIQYECSEAVITPMLKISESFPILQHLAWPINNVAPVPDFENLDRLTALTYLSISAQQPSVVHSLRLPAATTLRLEECALLPNRYAPFALPHLERLELTSAGNFQRLADLLENNNQSVPQLEHLTLAISRQPTIAELLVKILQGAPQLRTLEILQAYTVEDLQILSAVSDAVADFNIAAIRFAHVTIPTDRDRFDCFCLLSQLVDNIAAANIAALTTVDFHGHTSMLGLLSALSAAGTIDMAGEVVSIQAAVQQAAQVYELDWNNSLSGSHQTLQVRIL